MKIIGITGPTGGGKTTALGALKSLGALVIDCDAVYHELLETNDAMLHALAARFPGVVTDGKLDRKALGKIVFSDAEALAALNTITHKYVDEEVDRRLDAWAAAGGTLVAIDAIVLIESELREKCDIVVGVTAPFDVRVKRIMARDGISEEYARLRIAAQPPDSFYEDNCDYILVGNDSTAEEFEAKARLFFIRILGGTTDA